MWRGRAEIREELRDRGEGGRESEVSWEGWRMGGREVRVTPPPPTWVGRWLDTALDYPTLSYFS